MITAPLLLLPHNWDESVRRKLSWKTDVLVSRDGREQRRRVRANPIETLTYKITTVSDAEAGALLGLLWTAENLRIALPLWQDSVVLATPMAMSDTILTSTVAVGNRRLIGDAVLFWEGEAEEAVEVIDAIDTTITLASGVATAWPSGVFLVPIVYARVLAPLEGDTYGQLKGTITVVAQVEEDVIGLSGTGGAAAAMVPATVDVNDEGFTNEFSFIARGDIKGYVVDVRDADGNLIPDPTITINVLGPGVDVYPQGMPGLFNAKNTKTSGSPSGVNVEFTAGTITTTVSIGLT